MTDGEKADLDRVQSEKETVAQPIIDKYNATYLKLKTRCDARMRRARSKPKTNKEQD